MVLTRRPPERASEPPPPPHPPPPESRTTFCEPPGVRTQEIAVFPPCSVTHARGVCIITGSDRGAPGTEVPGVQLSSGTRDVHSIARGQPGGYRGNDLGPSRGGHLPVTPARSALRPEGCGAPRADGKMAAAGGPAGKGRDISLAALRRHDPYISRIVDVASQVALYTFGHRANEWVRAGGRGRGEAGGGAGEDDPPAVLRSGDPDRPSPGPSRGVDQTHGAGWTPPSACPSRPLGEPRRDTAQRVHVASPPLSRRRSLQPPRKPLTKAKTLSGS